MLNSIIFVSTALVYSLQRYLFALPIKSAHL